MKKYVSVFLLVILIFSIVLTGCTKETPSGATGDQNEVETTGGESSTFKAQITFNGSSTLAPVISAIATDFIEEYTTWDKVNSKFPAENIAIYVSAGGSGAGVKAVLEATSDFGMLAREIKDEENQKIGEPRAFTLGIDALTISVNPENPLVKIRDNPPPGV
jgi:phosphate transport system substrate-binding protein